MNKCKKIVSAVLICFILLSSFSTVFASELKTKLDIIKQVGEIKDLENNQGYVSKSIVDANPEEGEVTIELKLSNTKKETEEKVGTEIFFVVDNSPSMDFVTSTGETRKDLVLNSALQLVTSIFDETTNVKIGLIDFHGKGFFTSAGIWNATVRQRLTDDKQTVLNSIQEQLERSTSSGTNIEAGLLEAKDNFTSSQNNKIIILLTDGIPNADASGNSSSDDVTTEESLLIAENTKNTLLKLKEEGIYTITLLTGMSETDGNTDKDGEEYPSENTIEEELAAAENIFGTEDNPTADKYYLVSNLNINQTITNDIKQDVINKINNPISAAKIVDYFPQDITENFEFSYVGTPSMGTVSETIDEQTKTITWDVGTLKSDEIATLKYKLKIKDMQNNELFNKTIATNEKVVLTYQILKKDFTVTLTGSPEIRLTSELEATVTYDPTTYTTGKVTATIKTNRKVKEVEGWTISEDGKTLTKEYSKNAIEIVHLVDEYNITKDVEIVIANIITDTTVVDKEEIPNAGVTTIINTTLIVGVLAIGGYTFIKLKNLKDV